MCPSHFVAKRDTVAFVAILLERFDLEMDGGPQRR
jgi:hypothetical protein